MKDSRKTKEWLICEIKELRDSLKKQISERKRVENALSESEGKYRKLIETANDAIFIADAETGIILYANRQAEEMMNMTAEEIIGMHQKQLHPEDEAGDYKKIFSEHVQSGNGISEDIVVCRKDGHKIPVEISASAIEWSGKKVVQGIFRDITGRKRIEDALSQSKERMHYILDNTTSVIYLKDTHSKYLFVNRQYQNLFHVSKEEAVGKTDYDIFPKEMADTFQTNDRKVLRTKTPLKIEEVAPHDDGPHTYISTKFPLFDSNGIVCGICGISTDITERKKAEKILQAQKEALEQKNIALNEILGQIEIEKKQIKDNVIANAENLLLPIIQQLRLTGESRKYVQLLQKNLQELTSSFGTKLTEKRAKLTSREIEVCNMLKNGLTSKEIAGLLNISPRTVETHRIKIRNKLGIIKKDLNLSSFLKTL